MPSVKELLTKLGMAIYLHRGQIQQAEKAREAVQYLAEQGVFSSDVTDVHGLR